MHGIGGNEEPSHLSVINTKKLSIWCARWWLRQWLDGELIGLKVVMLRSMAVYLEADGKLFSIGQVLAVKGTSLDLTETHSLNQLKIEF